jgi:hypothetical protein
MQNFSSASGNLVPDINVLTGHSGPAQSDKTDRTMHEPKAQDGVGQYGPDAPANTHWSRPPFGRRLNSVPLGGTIQFNTDTRVKEFDREKQSSLGNGVG